MGDASLRLFVVKKHHGYAVADGDGQPLERGTDEARDEVGIDVLHFHGVPFR